jgi:DNA-binding CsgD family transcriptional regulator
MQRDESSHLVRHLQPAMLGFGLFWAWVFIFFGFEPLDTWSFAGADAVLWAHLASLVATIPVYLTAAFAHRLVRRLLDNRLFCLVMVVLMAGGTFLFLSLGLTSHPFLQLTGAFLTGLTSPCLLLLWGEQYGRLQPRALIIYTALSFLLAAVLRLAVFSLPPFVIAIIVTVIPLLSLFMLRVHRNVMEVDEAGEVGEADEAGEVEKASEAGGPDGQSRRSFNREELKALLPPRMLIGFLVVMFIYGGAVSLHHVNGAQGIEQMVSDVTSLLVVGAGALGIGLFTSRKGLNLGIGFRLSLLLIAALFIPLALLDSSFTPLSSFFASAGCNAIEILSWILLAYLAAGSRVPIFTIFAACNTVFHIGMAAGELSGIALADHVLLFSIFAICALVALSGFAFTDRDTTILLHPPNANELNQIIRKSGVMESSVAGIAEEFGLSEREREVLELWSVGYGAKAIEKKLFISPSTIKTHIQHIYEKCGVHSRMEVIALLERYSSEAERRTSR